MENHFNHIRWPPLYVTIFIMHVRNWAMGATPMAYIANNMDPDQSDAGS